MSGTLNKVMLIGHLGDEVKMNYFEGGGCIGRFPVATNETYTNRQTGERVSNTEWHNVVVRNKAAEVCEKYLKKGDKIYVEGRIKTRKCIHYRLNHLKSAFYSNISTASIINGHSMISPAEDLRLEMTICHSLDPSFLDRGSFLFIGVITVTL